MRNIIELNRVSALHIAKTMVPIPFPPELFVSFATFTNLKVLFSDQIMQMLFYKYFIDS